MRAQRARKYGAGINVPSSAASAGGSASASAFSGAGSSNNTLNIRRGALDTSQLIQRLLHEPPASPPPAEYRARGAHAPPAPMTLRELYDARFEVIRSPRWREQLLDRPAHMRNSETDVAGMVLALDEGLLKDMLAFDGGGKAASCFVSGDSGVWRQSDGPHYHEVYNALVQLSDLMDRTIITPLKALIKRQRVALQKAAAEGATPTLQEELQAARMESEDHMEELVSLYEHLRRVGYQQGVIKCIVTQRLIATSAEGVREDTLDTARNCIAFYDGVFCFDSRKLLTGAAARAKFITLTVKYRFEDLRAAVLASSINDDDDDDDDDFALPPSPSTQQRAKNWVDYNAFVDRIYGSHPGLRPFVMDALASSALNEILQVILFHHGEKGANGKSSFFSLVQGAFGELHESCSAAMLNATSKTSAGSANEELISTKSKRLIQMTELCSKEKLSAASIKGITGGDQQSARGLYQKKQKFVNRAVIHLLCNSIPELNDCDGGTMRRLRSVPYASRFVETAGEVDEAAHVYLKQDLEARFESWKFFLMHEVMTAAIVRAEALSRGVRVVVPVPDCVMADTRKLVEREDTLATFIRTMLVRTGETRDRLTLMAANDAYVNMCGDGKAPEKKAALKTAMLGAIGPFATESNGWRNYWRGWVLKGGDGDRGDSA